RGRRRRRAQRAEIDRAAGEDRRSGPWVAHGYLVSHADEAIRRAAGQLIFDVTTTPPRLETGRLAIDAPLPLQGLADLAQRRSRPGGVEPGGDTVLLGACHRDEGIERGFRAYGISLGPPGRE